MKISSLAQTHPYFIYVILAVVLQVTQLKTQRIYHLGRLWCDSLLVVSCEQIRSDNSKYF